MISHVASLSKTPDFTTTRRPESASKITVDPSMPAISCIWPSKHTKSPIRNWPACLPVIAGQLPM
jgi:hypothetical protein